MAETSKIDASLPSSLVHESISTAANNPIFDLSPNRVRILELNKGAERISRDREHEKSDELWLGTAFDPNLPDGDDISVYIRVADPMPVVAELLCAVIGRALHLPVPEPFVVFLPSGSLPNSSKLAYNKSCLAFASHNVGESTFSQLLRADSESAHAMLLKWEHLIPVTTFDEWVANSDRNLGNILFVSNVLWLIDHAEAFHGSSRSLFGLADLVEQGASNILGDKLARTSLEECALYLDKAKEWLSDFASRINISEAVACAELRHWQSDDQKAELIDFLNHRLTLTHNLLCNRLRHPQLHH